MANWTSGILTNQGRDLQLKVEAGANLKITRFKLGDGTETAADAKDLHDLIGTKIAFGITGIERTNGLCKFTGVVTSSNVAAGFRAREWGLFAEDPDKGEILYMVSLDDRPDYIAAQDAVLNSTFVYALNVDISQATKIEPVIDPAGLVTAEMLQKAAGLLQRNTTYALKDTIFDIQLAGHPSWRLVCTKAGTTSGTLLNLQDAKLNDVYPDGTAEWTVKDGYTSAVEEHNAAPDAHENQFAALMAALSGYLPLTGGVMTGNVTVNPQNEYKSCGMNHYRTDGYLEFMGAPDWWKGAALQLYGKDYLRDGLANCFRLSTGDGGCSLIGGPNHGLLWDGILTLGSKHQNHINQIRCAYDDAYLEILGSTSFGMGASIQMYGNNYTKQPHLTGVMRIGCHNHSLYLCPDGRMMWDSTDIGASGVVAKMLGQTGYIKYASGLIIQWGLSGVPQNHISAIIFPVAFSTLSYVVMGIAALGNNDDGERAIGLRSQSKTYHGCEFYTARADSPSAYYFAIGI